jgi:hypothetical protein
MAALRGRPLGRQLVQLVQLPSGCTGKARQVAAEAWQAAAAASGRMLGLLLLVLRQRLLRQEQCLLQPRLLGPGKEGGPLRRLQLLARVSCRMERRQVEGGQRPHRAGQHAFVVRTAHLLQGSCQGQARREGSAGQLAERDQVDQGQQHLRGRGLPARRMKV